MTQQNRWKIIPSSARCSLIQLPTSWTNAHWTSCVFFIDSNKIVSSCVNKICVWLLWKIYGPFLHCNEIQIEWTSSKRKISTLTQRVECTMFVRQNSSEWVPCIGEKTEINDVERAKLTLYSPILYGHTVYQWLKIRNLRKRPALNLPHSGSMWSTLSMQMLSILSLFGINFNMNSLPAHCSAASFQSQ